MLLLLLKARDKEILKKEGVLIKAAHSQLLAAFQNRTAVSAVGIKNSGKNHTEFGPDLRRSLQVDPVNHVPAFFLVDDATFRAMTRFR
ncbi:MAG: hypothetical protein GVY36_01640 [Verrucomicrobia bacterium]|nr:hypothetical protein [Verrucomicrobiota bacterium]